MADGWQYLVAFNNGPMDDPALITTVAAGGNPATRTPPTLGGANVWTDITQYVVHDSHGRGRQHELDRFEAGAATLLLNNSTADFSTWNTSSPFYGKLLPGKLLQIRIVYLGVSYTRYTGNLYTYSAEWPNEIEGYTTLKASDAFRLLALADITSARYSSGVLALSPSGYWRLGEITGTVAADSSGNGRDASFFNTPVLGVQGAIASDTNLACDLNARKGAVRLPTSAAPTGSGNWTIEIWFRLNSLYGYAASSVPDSLYSQTAIPLTGENIALDLNTVYPGTGKIGDQYYLTANVQDNAGTNFLGTTTAYTQLTGGWNHAVLVRNGNNLLVYLNGALMSGSTSTSGTPVIPTPTSGPFIGWPSYLVSGWGNVGLDGAVDEVAIYNGTVLTAAQILANYQAGAGAWAVQDSGTRIGKVLDTVGWSAGARQLDTGSSNVQSVTSSLTTTKSLTYMQLVELSEDGALFMTKDGKVRFVSRQNIASALTVAATFGDNAQENNILTAENASFEGGTTGTWNAAPGLGYTGSTHANTATFAADGTKAVQLTLPTATAAHACDMLNVAGLVIGQQYCFSMYVRVPTGSPAMKLAEGFGTVTTLPVQGYPFITTVNDAFQRIAVTFTATATTHALMVTNNTASTAGQLVVFDAVQVVRGISPVPFTTALSEIAFQADPEITLDDLDIWNEGVTTREGGTNQAYQDAASIASYGRRTLSIDGLLVTTDAEALYRSQYNVDHYAQPATRIRSIAVRPGTAVYGQVQTLLGLDLLSRVQVNRHFIPGSTVPFSQLALIEKLSEEVDAESGTWIMSLALSATDAARAYWLLGDATYGLLGSTTRLGY